MALTYPLALLDLFDSLKVASSAFMLEHMQQISGAGTGQVITADLAPARWTAKFETVPMVHDEAEALMAALDSLGGGLRTFMAAPSTKLFPKNDPDGTILGAAAVTVGSVTDSFNLSLAGLPAGYQLAQGDFVQIDYGSPASHYLGRLVTGATADGLGALGPVQIAPELPAGVLAGDAVVLKKPAAKFKLDAGSVAPKQVGTLHQSAGFSATQTYEAD